MRVELPSAGPRRRPETLLAAALLVALLAGTSGAQDKATTADVRPVEAVDPLPVVFVPGTAGSELHLKDAEKTLYWISPSSLRMDVVGKALGAQAGAGGALPEAEATEIMMNFESPLTPEALEKLERFGLKIQIGYHLPVYEGLVVWGRKSFGRWTWFEAPYDWRLGAGGENSRALDKVVDRARRLTGRDKVILLAHSLGGLVCRDYIAGPGRGKVDSLIAVGTPWLGAPKAVRGLLMGYSFGAGFAMRTVPLTDLRSLHVYIKDFPGPGEQKQVPSPTRISFFDPAATLRLARAYPCVFQQLPTPEFLRLYGAAAGHPDGRKSVVHGMTCDELLDFYKDPKNSNPDLYESAKRWRADRLGGDSYGVKHYLIGAVCDPQCDPADRMDMQMVRPDLISEAGPRRTRWERLDDLRSSKLKAGRRLLVEQTRSPRVPIYLDEYIASETGVEWGDGTSPLLSATAGAQARKDSTPDEAKARRLLGPDTEVIIRTLKADFGHASMLDDPDVRRAVADIVAERNK